MILIQAIPNAMVTDVVARNVAASYGRPARPKPNR
jgi:hypothetical protein